MMKIAGHDDSRFNVLDLEERGVFLSLETQERVIVGERIVGPVAEQLMTDIIERLVGVTPATFAHTLSTALRSELKRRAVIRTLAAEQAMGQTVLDPPSASRVVH